MYDRVEKSGFKSFNTVSNSIQSHYFNILNFFINRSTNASAESFNAKIKAFRSAFRGVRNVTFFLIPTIKYLCLKMNRSPEIPIEPNQPK